MKNRRWMRSAVAVIAGFFSVAAPGPEWYQMALAITAFPSVWLGGVLRQRGATP